MNERLLKHVKAAERILNTTKKFDARAPRDYKRDLGYSYDIHLKFYPCIYPFLLHMSVSKLAPKQLRAKTVGAKTVGRYIVVAEAAAPKKSTDHFTIFLNAALGIQSYWYEVNTR